MNKNGEMNDGVIKNGNREYVSPGRCRMDDYMSPKSEVRMDRYGVGSSMVDSTNPNHTYDRT